MSDETMVDLPTDLTKLSDDDIVELAASVKAAADAVQEQKDAISASVAGTVEGKLTKRMGFRKVKESQWLESLRLYLGSLGNYNVFTNEHPMGVSTDKLENKPQTNIVRNKCETAISQTMAFQFAAGDKNWDLRPPQVVDIDEEDMLQIQRMQGMQMSVDEVMAFKIDLMEREMETHLENCRYGTQARKSGWERVVLGTGIMKAPTNSTRLKKKYVKMPQKDGKILRVPRLVVENVPYIYRVNPWYFFPDDSVNDIEDAEDTIEVHPMSKTQLVDFLKNPGYMKDAVQKCLDEEPKQYINSPFNDPAYLTQGINLLKDRYLVLEYHGPIKKSDLETLGLSPAVDNSDEFYFAEVWVCNGRCIRVEFSNLEGCYRCPYVVSAWEPDPASIFGFGIPMLVRDQQRVVNETFKMMLDNAGISAGPQVIVDTTLIKPAEGGLECTPWKVWYAQEYGADVSKAIQFFMPQNAFEGLSALFTMSMGLADNESSIPNLTLNMGAPTGASDSATGMAIAQQSAASPLFYKSEQWDDQITKPLIEMLYDWEMQYNPKDEIKGTYDVDVKTSTSFLQNGISQQKLEKLLMICSQPNSPVTEHVNLDDLTQSFLLGMHLPSRTIVKTPEALAQERAKRPPAPPDPNLLKAQAEMEKVQNDKARIQLEAQQQQIDTGLKHQEAQMTYDLGVRTDQTRNKEADASVLKAQFDFKAAMAQLASADEQHRASLIMDFNVDQMKDQTQKFLAGGEMAMRARDQQLKDKELEVKKKTGSGI